MSMSASFSERLTFVGRSPAAVAAHDKAAWLGLFARYSLVEDPVGSRPCVSRPSDSTHNGPLARFYDTFIAANDIRFVVERDMIGGDVVEVSPPFDTTGATAVAGAHVAVELACLWTANKLSK